MPIYETLNATDTADMQSILSYANRVSGGIFMPIMLLVIWFIWVIGAAFSGKTIYRGVLFASFMCSIFSILFVLMKWMSVNIMYFFFFMTAVGLVWTRLAESYS